jgi:threonine/homoserine/homoserine lactone efflux protein
MDAAMGSYLIAGSTYAFAAAIQPGPFQAYLISRTLTNGFWQTLPAVFAPILSDLPIVCLVLFLLRRIPQLFIDFLQVAGGLLLLYLAAGAFGSYRHYRQIIPAGDGSVRQTVLKAALVNLLNPNPYLSWALILGPLLLKAWNQSPLDGVVFLGAFYGVMALAAATILLLFSSARSLGVRITRTLFGLSAAALGLFGIYQLWAGATAISRRL